MKNIKQNIKIVSVGAALSVFNLFLLGTALAEDSHFSFCQHNFQNYSEIIATDIKNQHPTAKIFSISTPSVVDWNYYPCSPQNTDLNCGSESWELSIKALIPTYNSKTLNYGIFMDLNIVNGTCSEVGIELQL